MLKRKILAQLIDWKNKKNHKSLIITGQRQIGKTYIVENSFSKEYESFIEINFVKNRDAIKIFDGNLDVETLMLSISALVQGAKFISGKTLILFDEVQECPNAIASLKFWTEDGRFDAIAMGSALGIKYKETFSYPVGYVEYIDMYSLDFEEMLWALDIDETVINAVRNCYLNKKVVPAFVHEQLMKYLKIYMVVGGMPEVVNAYVQTHNMSEVMEIQKRLLEDYKSHIAHYANASDKIKAEKCFESIPYQLSKENHKFQYSTVERKATASKFSSSIDWLNEQLLTIQITGLKKIEYPLEMYADQSNFRIYNTDIGMLMASYDMGVKRAIIEDGALEDRAQGLALGTAKGGLYEALAADMLYKAGHKHIFFYKHEKNTCEIEFIIQKDGEIIPIEIKAGKKKANSLKNILENNDQISFGYKMASQNVGQVEKLVILPMYMLMFV